MNILIVDDLLQNRKLLADLLRPYGQCDTVVDGQEAIDIFEGRLVDGDPYDLVLLDIMMPGVDGQEALAGMRQIERERHSSKEAIIIMVTAVDESQDVLKAFFRGGCDDYLIKPITKEDLFKKLGEYNLI